MPAPQAWPLSPLVTRPAAGAGLAELGRAR